MRSEPASRSSSSPRQNFSHSLNTSLRLYSCAKRPACFFTSGSSESAAAAKGGWNEYAAKFVALEPAAYVEAAGGADRISAIAHPIF